LSYWIRKYIIGKENILFYLFAPFAGVSVLDTKRRLNEKITLNSNVKRKKIKTT